MASEETASLAEHLAAGVRCVGVLRASITTASAPQSEPLMYHQRPGPAVLIAGLSGKGGVIKSVVTDLPVLASLPLDPALSALCDKGDGRDLWEQSAR